MDAATAMLSLPASTHRRKSLPRRNPDGMGVDKPGPFYWNPGQRDTDDGDSTSSESDVVMNQCRRCGSEYMPEPCNKDPQVLRARCSSCGTTHKMERSSVQTRHLATTPEQKQSTTLCMLAASMTRSATNKRGQSQRDNLTKRARHAGDNKTAEQGTVQMGGGSAVAIGAWRERERRRSTRRGTPRGRQGGQRARREPLWWAVRCVAGVAAAGGARGGDGP